jgi:uncharacterized protein YjbI with pentapeptide repeats
MSTKMTRDELVERLTQGLAKLKDTNAPADAKIDLTNADLSEVNLDKIEFYRCDFTGACFDAASLCGAKFQTCSFKNVTFNDADLICADINGCRLEKTVFVGANLSSVSISNSTFICCLIKDADMSDARVTNTQATATELISVTLDRAELEGFHVEFGCMWSCHGSHTKITRSSVSTGSIRQFDVDHATIVGTRFSGCTIERSEFIKAELNDVSFNGSAIALSEFQDCSIVATNWHNAHLICTTFHQTVVRNSQWQPNVKSCDIRFVHVSKEYGRHTVAIGAHMDMRDQVFESVSFKLDLSGGDFRGCTFRDCTFEGGTFHDADFTGAKFHGGSALGVDFSRAKLCKDTFLAPASAKFVWDARFTGLMASAQTRWPWGTETPECVVDVEDVKIACRQAYESVIGNADDTSQTYRGVVFTAAPDSNCAFSYTYATFPELFTPHGPFSVITTSGNVLHRAIVRVAEGVRVDATGTKLVGDPDKLAFACAMAAECISAPMASAMLETRDAHRAENELVDMITEYLRKNRLAIKKQSKK